MFFADIDAGGGYVHHGIIQSAAVQQFHGVLIVDGIVETGICPLDVQILAVRNQVELFSFLHFSDRIGGNGARLQLLLQLQTFLIGANKQHRAGEQNSILVEGVLLDVGGIFRCGTVEVADQPILIPLGSTGILHRLLWDIDPLVDFRKPVCKIIEAFILPVNCHHIQQNIGQRAKISGSEFFFYPRTYPIQPLSRNTGDGFSVGLNH